MSRQFRRYLKLESPMLRGEDVSALQARLGLAEAQRDGIFGSTTQRAVVAFQLANQLEPDGVVGPNTWTALFGAETLPPGAEQGSLSPGDRIKKNLPALKEPHRRYGGSITWRLTARGVETEGKGIETTSGKPETVRRVCNDYRDAIETAARKTGVPVELIIATMCTESHSGSEHGVNPRAERKEPGYVSDEATPHRVSYGLMQTLIATARQAMSQLKTGSIVSAATIDREWLFKPANSIVAGAAYIALQAIRTQFDPPVVACAYNAGSVIHNDSARNRWRMKQYPIGADAHANRFIQWFNDCFRLFAEEGCPFDATTTFWHCFHDPLASATESATTHPSSDAEQLVFVFPLKEKAGLDYKGGGRQFGAHRAGGARRHAGCDLKVPPKTPILAMADGTVVRGPSSFYSGTYSLEVRHDNGMVVRYGEIAGEVPKGIRSGAKVSRGQVIAFVGKLESGDSMLHLEMYSGRKEGPLTQTGTRFKRRTDLINPTKYLDHARLFNSPGTAVSEDVQNIPLEDGVQAPEARVLSKWEEALIDAPTTGASDKTAKQDGLERGGIEASRLMAENDWVRVKELAGLFQTAAKKFGIPAAVLAALAGRESRCGKSGILKDGWGDRGQAFGIMQIDRRSHKLEGLDDPKGFKGLAHIEQAAGIFCENLEMIEREHPDWQPPFVLKGAAVAYNAGPGNVRTIEKMDVGTTGDDYGSDVIARAKYYFEKEDAKELNA
jgi:peptidoglycan hydrolase-like protein with peptidoglycan-binding domain